MDEVFYALKEILTNTIKLSEDCNINVVINKFVPNDEIWISSQGYNCYADFNPNRMVRITGIDWSRKETFKQ
jgi:frataxin-like iron-binding protein CyaY